MTTEKERRETPSFRRPQILTTEAEFIAAERAIDSLRGMNASDPIRRFREIAAQSANHAVFCDGPVSPDADLLDLCAEALHLLVHAEKSSNSRVPYTRQHTEEMRKENDRLWKEAESLRKQAGGKMYWIAKKPAQTPAGIYAKALVVKSSVTGAARRLAKTLAEDLIACRELRESLWPADAENTRGRAI
jgi:hypothetical protein